MITYYYDFFESFLLGRISFNQFLTIQAGADITGQLQVRPMQYTLYISINVRVVKMLHTDNKQQTDRQSQVSNTETTLSSSSVDNRGSWPILIK